MAPSAFNPDDIKTKKYRVNNYHKCLFSKQTVVLRWWVGETKINFNKTN